MEAKKQQMAKEMAMVCFEITRLGFREWVG